MALTHRLLKRVQRPWGWEALVEVLDGTIVIEGFTPVFDHEPTDAEVTAIMVAIKARIQANLDYESVRSTIFDSIGPELKEALTWMVKKIRQNPNATEAQAETAWNAEWADSLFTFTKLAAYVQKLAGNVTWNQFKTYVIDHKFGGID